MVDAEKRRRLRRAASAWLASHPDSAGLDVAFEVVGVRGGRVSRLADDLDG
jgi:Holliday junction resolvase-like predicted endonuclease